MTMKLLRLGAAGIGFLLFSAGACSPWAPRAVFREQRFDSGHVRQGQNVAHEFSVHNAGNAPLEFERATLSLPGMTCRLPREIAPGGDGQIKVEWSTVHLQGRAEGVAVVRTNDPARSEYRLVVAGDVEGPIELKPLPMVFLSAFQGESASRTMTLVNHQNQPIAVRQTRPAGAHFISSLRSVEAGHLFDLVVGVAPGAAPGHYDESLVVEVGGPEPLRLEVPVHLLVKADLYANPDVVDLGDIPLDHAVQAPGVFDLLRQTILVKRRAGEFRIVSVRTDVPALHITMAPSGPSATFRIEVALSPERLAQGTLSGSIWLATDDQKIPEIVIPVRGRVI
ncbi:MAG: hypothetical protein AUG09_02500 [Acidobacteria bacterium 13_1_20CM_2_68_7]|nr:MAG: hypothetical protein AUG09_02500 [Acidobacteria bacterium 13_1_20CM_2_68_7]